MYFVRFIQEEAQAEKDFERGFSFSDYALFDTVEDALDAFGIEDRDSVELVQDNYILVGKWGIALNGLCGFGGFETVEEAEEYGLENSGYNGVQWPAFAIFEGRGIVDSRVWDGDCFVPSRISKVIYL